MANLKKSTFGAQAQVVSLRRSDGSVATVVARKRAVGEQGGKYSVN